MFKETGTNLPETLLRNMVEGVLAVDSQGRITLINLAVEHLFTAAEPEVLGKSVRMGLRNNEIANLIEEVLKSGKAVEREVEILVPIEASFLALASPLKDERGTVTGAVCILHDVTELRKLERYRSEFIANISHELKTPLTSIRNYVETLINGAIDDKQHNVEFLKKIEKHSLGLSALIDDILEISELESRKEMGPFVRVDLVALVSHAAEAVSNKAEKKKISIEKRCEGGPHNISGIEDHIYRAILNLLDNAVNHTSDGGKVSISCSKKNDNIEISVSDTGIGIAQEHLPRIFERFYRVDKARSRNLGGTGLGLAIVKHVMNLHNGTVEVESVVGRGSTFTLLFPVPL